MSYHTLAIQNDKNSRTALNVQIYQKLSKHQLPKSQQEQFIFINNNIFIVASNHNILIENKIIHSIKIKLEKRE